MFSGDLVTFSAAVTTGERDRARLIAASQSASPSRSTASVSNIPESAGPDGSPRSRVRRATAMQAASAVADRSGSARPSAPANCRARPSTRGSM